MRSTSSELSNKYKSYQVFLDGMSGEEVVSDQVRLVTRLKFHYGVLVKPGQDRPLPLGRRHYALDRYTLEFADGSDSDD